jgi:hypothetical protein
MVFCSNDCQWCTNVYSVSITKILPVCLFLQPLTLFFIPDGTTTTILKFPSGNDQKIFQHLPLHQCLRRPVTFFCVAILRNFCDKTIVLKNNRVIAAPPPPATPGGVAPGQCVPQYNVTGGRGVVPVRRLLLFSKCTIFFFSFVAHKSYCRESICQAVQ